MLIFGVIQAPGCNNVAGIVIAGELVSLVEEERLNRFKHSPPVSLIRSVLADPLKPAMKGSDNKSVKNRDAWRPFAPSFSDEKLASRAE